MSAMTAQFSCTVYVIHNSMIFLKLIKLKHVFILRLCNIMLHLCLKVTKLMIKIDESTRF